MPRRTASTATRSSALPGDAAAEPLHRGALRLLRLLRREDTATGIGPARLSALSVLVFGGPSSLGALAAAEQVSAPTMSRLVVELERDGWLKRLTDKTDARSTRLEATTAARKLLERGRARRLDALSAAIRTLSRADRAALGAATEPLERLVRALAANAAPTLKRSSRRRFD